MMLGVTMPDVACGWGHSDSSTGGTVEDGELLEEVVENQGIWWLATTGGIFGGLLLPGCIACCKEIVLYH